MLYDFRHIPRSSVRYDAGTIPTRHPNTSTGPITTRSIRNKRPRLYNQTNVNVPEETVYSLIPALHHTDIGIRNYFSDIKVPTDDGIRSKNVPIRIAGGDKTTLYWKQAVKNSINGRIALPTMALNRESFEFNPLKFSPAYMPIARNFTDSAGTRMKLTYRPYPVIVNYTLGLWAERKRDLEYILFQIIPRFNGGLAEIHVDGGLVTGTVVMKFNTYTDNSDVEVDADTLAKVQYDISISAESWIPLPEKIVPTVLGTAASLRETTGEFLDIARVGVVAVSIGSQISSPK